MCTPRRPAPPAITITHVRIGPSLPPAIASRRRSAPVAVTSRPLSLGRSPSRWSSEDWLSLSRVNAGAMLDTASTTSGPQFVGEIGVRGELHVTVDKPEYYAGDTVTGRLTVAVSETIQCDSESSSSS